MGDVFLCSGQSNMELPVSRSVNAPTKLPAAANDWIRLLTVAHASSAAPLAHFQSPVAWAAAGPNTVGDFSAACYYFARELQKSVPVPLGLIQSSWSGSRIEPWISERACARWADSMALDLLRLYARDPKAGTQGWANLGEVVAHAAPAGSTPWKASRRRRLA